MCGALATTGGRTVIVFATVSTKGGVGKTTLTANLGALLADLGMRVLLVDADVQPSLTRYFPLGERAPHGLTEIITQGAIGADCISTIALPAGSQAQMLNRDGRLDLIASDAPEGSLQTWLAARIDRAVRIKLALRSPQIQDAYDVVLIDTQGAVGHLQDAAVLASDILLSPVSPDILTAREFTTGTQELLDRLEPSSALGISVPPMRAVIYRLERTTDSRTIARLIREKFVSLRGRVSVLDTAVPHAVAYRRAATERIPVHWLDANRAGRTMHALLWELIPSLDGCCAVNFAPPSSVAAGALICAGEAP